MTRRTLADWLVWQETLHPKGIDLGLDRVRAVARRLGLWPDAPPTITVAGTNGKGSSVALLEAILAAAGYRTGAYTSPHLLRYNERIRVGGVEAGDETIRRVFERVDAARGEVSLTYFEFGTLAALAIFQEAGVQALILEVGLGGRLDAVNCLDAHCALVTAIGIDHTEWLGPTRESIGFEKAGIFRAGRPAVCADPDPPASLGDHARRIGARLYRRGPDFDRRWADGAWSWWSGDRCLDGLPPPLLAGEHQLDNAAGVLMALAALEDSLPVDRAAIVAGLGQARLPGRCQVLPGALEWILDVSHNPHGATVLARCLASRPRAGHTRAVVGMLADKDIAGVAAVLAPVIDHWYAAGLEPPRGCSGESLAARLRAGGAHPVTAFPEVAAACRAAAEDAATGDRVLVFGSFFTVAAAWPMVTAQRSV